MRLFVRGQQKLSYEMIDIDTCSYQQHVHQHEFYRFAGENVFFNEIEIVAVENDYPEDGGNPCAAKHMRIVEVLIIENKNREEEQDKPDPDVKESAQSFSVYFCYCHCSC